MILININKKLNIKTIKKDRINLQPNNEIFIALKKKRISTNIS